MHHITNTIYRTLRWKHNKLLILKKTHRGRASEKKIYFLILKSNNLEKNELNIKISKMIQMTLETARQTDIKLCITIKINLDHHQHYICSRYIFQNKKIFFCVIHHCDNSLTLHFNESGCFVSSEEMAFLRIFIWNHHKCLLELCEILFIKCCYYFDFFDERWWICSSINLYFSSK